jgi:STE24 endopeptidase
VFSSKRGWRAIASGACDIIFRSVRGGFSHVRPTLPRGCERHTACSTMATAFTVLFVFFLLLMTGLRFWLASRQIRHVARHARAVPAQFASRVSLEAHRKAADYTIARQRLAMLEAAVGVALLVVLTLLGGVQALAAAVTGVIGGLPAQVAIVAGVAVILGAADLPFEWYRQFHIEEKFGFNRMTPRLFLVDTLKSVLVAAALGLPLLALVLWLMDAAGGLW